MKFCLAFPMILAHPPALREDVAEFAALGAKRLGMHFGKTDVSDAKK
jgi:hypothetical protein